MFGFSFSEVVLIGIVALVAVGPQRLPGMLRSMGLWIRKLRKMTTEVRAQTGIDDILRAEGVHGGLTELRSLMRGGGGHAPAVQPYRPLDDPYRQIEIDVTQEYPPEGADAKGALADDLSRDAPDPNDGPEPVAPAEAEPVAPVSAEPVAPAAAEAVAVAQAEPSPPPAEPAPPEPTKPPEALP